MPKALREPQRKARVLAKILIVVRRALKGAISSGSA